MTSINNITLEQFYAYKNANYDMPPELAHFYMEPPSFKKPINNRTPRNNYKSQPQKQPRYYQEPPPQDNWMTNQAAKKEALSEDDKLYTNYTKILNKLSDSNLNEFHKELIALPITTKEHLNKLINILVSKILTEQKYVSLYAKLSKLLAEFYISESSTDDFFESSSTKVYFKSLLLPKCQQMFNNIIETKEENIDKSKNHIEYIGELFNHDILNDNIITGCLKRLYTNKQIEIWCHLMKTVGKKYFKVANGDAKLCMSTINQLKTSKEVSVKDKFAIMDIIDYAKVQRW